MRERFTAGRLPRCVDQLLRSLYVRLRSIRHQFEYPGGQGVREENTSIDRPRIQLQCVFEELDGLREIFAVRTLVEDRASAEDTIKCIRIFGRPRSLCADEFQIQRDGDPAGYLILQCEQVVCCVVETVCPQMRVRFGIDEL